MPVLHLGQPEAVEAITTATPGTIWTVVELRCSRDTARARLIQRGIADLDQRLTALDQTQHLNQADLVIDTEQLDIEQAATTILRAHADLRRRRVS